MRRLIPLTALATLATVLSPSAISPAAAPKLPRRIVSLNLCADQYLMALADPGQIVALTRFARDPNMSAVATRASTMPSSRGSAEDVLMLRPDLVIASPFRRKNDRRRAGAPAYLDARSPPGR